MARTFTMEEVALHNSENDAWLVVDGKVYDVTKFAAEHPGGKKILLREAGKESTKKFKQFHNAEAVLRQYGPQLLIGEVDDGKVVKPPPLPVEGPFGSGLPYAEPNWYQGWKSPYYNDSHRRFRAALREFHDREILPNVHEWDESKQIPREVFKKMADFGLFGAMLRDWPKGLPEPEIAGGAIVRSELDAFHALIFVDEMNRSGSGGFAWGVMGGLGIGIPPVLNFGSSYLLERVAGPCLMGDKVICLAITEPSGGSDVANLKCSAVKTSDGRHYIVNGEKKWITNGTYADFFTVAVRTGEGMGMGGISLLVVERGMPGVTTKQMQCSGVWSSGTAYITFEDVKVPVENLIGKENHGFKYIMFNFNHERFFICAMGIRMARICVEEAFAYAFKRKTFGKRLIDHAVIRNKLAHMMRQVESTHAWLEQITYQMNTMTHKESSDIMRLGGPLALLKAQMSVTLEFCAREAAQIFGGLAYTRGGQGEKVERIYREVRALAIPAGSEEIMLDLGVRMAMRGAKL